MGTYVRARCPVCGWQLPGKVWRRGGKDDRAVGLLFHSGGNCSLTALGPVRSPGELEEHDRGLFSVMVDRLVGAVVSWVRWGWLDLTMLLNALPLHYLGGGMWVQNFEREGKRPISRAGVDYDAVSGGSQVIYRRKVLPITGRGERDYGW